MPFVAVCCLRRVTVVSSRVMLRHEESRSRATNATCDVVVVVVVAAFGDWILLSFYRGLLRDVKWDGLLVRCVEKNNT